MRSGKGVPAAVLVAALLLSCSVAEAVIAKAADNEGENNTSGIAVSSNMATSISRVHGALLSAVP